jgi:hypothetical protein
MCLKAYCPKYACWSPDTLRAACGALDTFGTHLQTPKGMKHGKHRQKLLGVWLAFEIDCCFFVTGMTCITCAAHHACLFSVDVAVTADCTTQPVLPAAMTCQCCSVTVFAVGCSKQFAYVNVAPGMLGLEDSFRVRGFRCYAECHNVLAPVAPGTGQRVRLGYILIYGPNIHRWHNCNSWEADGHEASLCLLPPHELVCVQFDFAKASARSTVVMHMGVL